MSEPTAINIRDIFVPTRPNYCFVDADWSQVENRLGAILAGERFLLDAFARGEDIYKKVYAQMFKVPLEQVTKAQRQVGKQLVLGQNYGMGPGGLAERLECSVEEAEQYIKQYWEANPATRAAKESLNAFAKKEGYVRTYFGRKRFITGLNSYGSERSSAEREVWNTFIQGTAADILKIAIIRLDRIFKEKKWPARIVLPIHDEILAEMDVFALDPYEVGLAFKEAMEIPVTNQETKETIVLPAEVDYGWRFGSLGKFAQLIENAPSEALKERLGKSTYFTAVKQEKKIEVPAAPAMEQLSVDEVAGSPAEVEPDAPGTLVRTKEDDFQRPAIVLYVDRQVSLPGDFYPEFASALAVGAGVCFYLIIQGREREVYKARALVPREFLVYLKANNFRVEEIK